MIYFHNQNLEPLSYLFLFWIYPPLYTSRLVAMFWQHETLVYRVSWCLWRDECCTIMWSMVAPWHHQKWHHSLASFSCLVLFSSYGLLFIFCPFFMFWRHFHVFEAETQKQSQKRENEIKHENEAKEWFHFQQFLGETIDHILEQHWWHHRHQLTLYTTILPLYFLFNTFFMKNCLAFCAHPHFPWNVPHFLCTPSLFIKICPTNYAYPGFHMKICIAFYAHPCFLWRCTSQIMHILVWRCA